MSEYTEVSHTVTVPKSTGRQGFLRTIEEILKLSRVQEIIIDARGQVRYRRYIVQGENDSPLGVDYEGLEPHSIIRSGEVSEVANSGEGPLVLLPGMLDRVSSERLSPVCWVVGGNSNVWHWLGREGLLPLTQSHLYGIPLKEDASIPDSVLILCAAFNKNAALVDCHRFLKLDMELPEAAPITTVDVL